MSKFLELSNCQNCRNEKTDVFKIDIVNK